MAGFFSKKQYIGREQVGNKIVEELIPKVFNLRDVLQLIIDRFYQNPFPQQTNYNKQEVHL